MVVTGSSVPRLGVGSTLLAGEKEQLGLVRWSRSCVGGCGSPGEWADPAESLGEVQVQRRGSSIPP